MMKPFKNFYYEYEYFFKKYITVCVFIVFSYVLRAQDSLTFPYYPIESVKLVDKGQDLLFLKKELINVKIVGLGEATHGSKEVFMIKHRLIKFLITELQFNTFAIEASEAECEQLNQYLLTGQGNAKNLLAKLGFWTWYTESFLDLLHWMKEYNHTSQQKIKFVGIDFLIPDQAIQNIRSYPKDSKLSILWGKYEQLHRKVLKLYQQQQYELPKALNDSLYIAINEIYNYSSSSKLKNDSIQQLVNNIQLLVQYHYMQAFPVNEGYRDSCMYRNLQKHITPQVKIIVWAHNGHLKKSENTLGKWIYKDFKEQYVVFGFSLYKGNYTAVDQYQLTSNPLSIPDSSSYEYYLNQIPDSIFVIPIDTTYCSTNLYKQLCGKRNFREIGSMKREQQFYPANLITEYDYIIHIKNTSASKILPYK